MTYPDDYINKIICGDCLEVMKGMPDKCIDLTVTSPPYDDLRNYQGYKFNFKSIAKQLFRVTKQGGVIAWIVGDATKNGSESGSSFKQALYFKDIGFNLHDTMIYEKNGPPYPAKNTYYQIFEYMFILSKGRPKTFNPIKDRKNRWAGQKWSPKRTRRTKEGELKEGPWYIHQDSKYGVRFNIWRYHTGAGYSTKDEIAFNHPATFPEKLAEDHIISWSNEGDVVLDPMCGSGTTCKMAKFTKRYFIDIEISPKYCKIDKERLRQGVL